jgi:DNA-binding response OmpR family regulator
MSSHTVPGALVDDFRVLVVEDEPLYARAIYRELKRHDVACDVAGTVRDGLARAARGRYAVVLLDHRLPDGDGVLSIPHFRTHQIAAAVIVMTAYETIDDAVQAIRLGAEEETQ